MSVEIYYTELKHNIVTHRQFAASITININNYIPTKTYHAVDRIWGKVATLTPYRGCVFMVRYISLYFTNIKNIIFKIKFTVLNRIEKLTLCCWLHILHIIVSSTSAYNERRLSVEPSSKTTYPWRLSAIFGSPTSSNLPPHHPST
jgi:hypothetical protein